MDTMNRIVTERLILRPFKKEDAEAMFHNWTYDERVVRFCRWHPHTSLSETEQYLNICMNSQYCWAITLKEKDEPVGCIDVVSRNSMGTCEIGYVLSYEFWSKGIMTEALKAVISELFECGFDVIGACHALDNPASGKVMEKSGLTYVRNAMALKKFGSDELVEVKCYEIRKRS